jgi:hypothetical protein
VEEEFTPEAMEASARFRIIDLTLNSELQVEATDLCSKGACDDDVAPALNVFTVGVDNEDEADGTPATLIAAPYPIDRSVYPSDVYVFDRFGRQVDVTDDKGVVYYQTFAVDNSFTFQQPNPTCVDPQGGCEVAPASTAFSFVQATDNVSMTGSYGLLVADVCNAAVFDPETGAGVAGRAQGNQPVANNQGMGIIPAFDSTLLKGDDAVNASTTLPEVFAVEQNYPNPFVGTTTIEVALPEATDLRVEIYNVLGQRVRVLADGRLDGGVHSLQFEAAGLPGGTYVYRVSTPEKSMVRSMVLVH